MKEHVMSDHDVDLRPCPFCRQDVKPDAIRCKHCLADIPATTPDHQGTCPFCKEDIDPEATRCMHCKANLDSAWRQILYPRRPMSRGTRRGATGAPLMLRRADRTRADVGESDPTRAPTRAAADPGCNDYDIDDAGTWCFVESSEHYCIYELCDPAPVSPYPIFR